MAAISPSIAAMFFVSVIAQLVGINTLPLTKGFTQPLPTAIALASFALGIGLLARLMHNGIQLGYLMPLMSTILPLCTVFIGVFFYGDVASFTKIGMLVVACLLIGTATMV